MKKFRYLRNKTVLRSVCAALVFFLVLGTAPLFKAHAGTNYSDVPVSYDGESAGTADITLSHSPSTVKCGLGESVRVSINASSNYSGYGETTGSFVVTNASSPSFSESGIISLTKGVSGYYAHQNGDYLEIKGEEMGECDLTVNVDVRISNAENDSTKDVIVVGGLNYTLHVKVTAAISVAPATLSMKVGDSPAQLTANVNPNYESVTWESSDESVATVDNEGNVTPVSEGQVNITASAGGATAACVVTVTEDSTSSDDTSSDTSSDPGSDTSSDPSAPVYTFKADGSSTWKKGSGEDMHFTVTKTPNEPEVYTEFEGLELDGKKLVRDTDYTADPGSVLITLYADKLESLSKGSHTLKVFLSTGDKPEMSFTVASSGSSSPETGENSLPFTVCALLMFFSLAGFVFVFYKRELQINE